MLRRSGRQETAGWARAGHYHNQMTRVDYRRTWLKDGLCLRMPPDCKTLLLALRLAHPSVAHAHCWRSFSPSCVVLSRHSKGVRLPWILDVW